jgi:hypothetical protein
MLGDVTYHRRAFLQCAWKLRLRRKRVVHADHSHVARGGVFAGQPVVRVDRGLEEPAAVEVDHHGQGLIRPRPIETAENAPTMTNNPAIAGLSHHRPARRRLHGYRFEGLTVRPVRQLHSDRWMVCKLLADIPEERGEFGINA